jgi:hypothetical protein
LQHRQRARERERERERERAAKVSNKREREREVLCHSKTRERALIIKEGGHNVSLIINEWKRRN